MNPTKITTKVKAGLKQRYGEDPRKWRIPGLSEHCDDAKFCRADELLKNTCNKVFWAATGIKPKATLKRKKAKKPKAKLKKGRPGLAAAKRRNLVLYKGGNPNKKSRSP